MRRIEDEVHKAVVAQYFYCSMISKFIIQRIQRQELFRVNIICRIFTYDKYHHLNGYLNSSHIPFPSFSSAPQDTFNNTRPATQRSSNSNNTELPSSIKPYLYSASNPSPCTSSTFYSPSSAQSLPKPPSPSPSRSQLVSRWLSDFQLEVASLLCVQFQKSYVVAPAAQTVPTNVRDLALPYVDPSPAPLLPEPRKLTLQPYTVCCATERKTYEDGAEQIFNQQGELVQLVDAAADNGALSARADMVVERIPVPDALCCVPGCEKCGFGGYECGEHRDCLSVSGSSPSSGGAI